MPPAPRVYLDHAATTPCDPRVAALVAEELGRARNASSVHQEGQAARRRLEEAREALAALLRCKPEHVVFTSGATESNNLAIRGLAGEHARPLRVLSSPLEHSCVRETLAQLAARGAATVASMEVTSAGRAVVPSTVDADLLCLMHAQNETGVVQDVAAAREACRAGGARWLCDITQSFAHEAISLKVLGADFVSLSSHKLHGPAGVGALAGPGVEAIAPQITGGPQEGGHRAGTQPVALILGFLMAAELAVKERAARDAHLASIEERLLTRLRDGAVGMTVNGGESGLGMKLPGFMSLSFPDFSGPDLVIALDMAGFAVSSGSACATGVMEPSPAMLAMHGGDIDRAASALRVTPSHLTSKSEIDAFAEALLRIVKPR